MRRSLAYRGTGFTLLEVMVALTVLSVMAVVILQAYRAGLGVWEQGQRRGVVDDAARAFWGRMSAQLRAAYPWMVKSRGGSFLFFKGGRDEVEFVTMQGLTSERDEGMMHVMRYSLEHDGESRVLMVREFPWPRRAFVEESEEAVFEEKLSHVEEFSLEYEIVKRTSPTAQGGATTEKRKESEWSGQGENRGKEYVSSVTMTLTLDREVGEGMTFTATVPVMAAPWGGD